MKRPIKFRGVVISRRAAVGREADIGDSITGSLIIEDDGFNHQSYWIRHKKKGYAAIDYPVAPDSIAQLVGYDRDGNEVYEGDTIEFTCSRPGDRASRNPQTATLGLRPEIYADGKDYSKKLLRYKLKEAQS